jgi:ribosome-associated translation inhibitor RaiA
MNLNITGHHVEVTPAIRDYVNGQTRTSVAAFRSGDQLARHPVG